MSTGDPGTDALVVFIVIALFMGPLVLLAWPLENTERGRRLADALLERLFGHGS